MISGVEVDEWNLTAPEMRPAATKKIQTDNEKMDELQGVEILWMGWRNRLIEDQRFATMVVEASTPELGHAILDMSFMVGRQQNACSMFNKACRTIQCFRCYHYGHATFQCTEEERCGHCADPRSTSQKPVLKATKENVVYVEETTGHGKNPAQKSRRRYRVYYIRDRLPPFRFPVKGTTTKKDFPYFGDKNLDISNTIINFDGPPSSGNKATGG
ncbi:hypothetical protein MMC28_011209 [Mycoblastus sanguinarius]|nr:hypothetical protein [Mycoblastus sanguinarius]